jgi:hypothetical protein
MFFSVMPDLIRHPEVFVQTGFQLSAGMTLLKILAIKIQALISARALEFV